MSAETLRKASARIRRDAERMPAGPYGMTSAWTTPSTMLSRVTHKDGVVAEVRGRDGDGQGCYTVMYFASWHPAVAFAIADLLDDAAAFLAAYPGYTHAEDAPLKVARAYLGEQSPSPLPPYTRPTTCGECGDDLAPGQMGYHGECLRLQDGA